MKIAIIGGGMAGLGAAYEISRKKKNVEITIFEKSDQIGGLAFSKQIQGSFIEGFYHHLFPTYRDIIEVSKELGIGEKLFFRKAKTANFINGKIYSFSSGLDLLRYKPLRPFARVRTACAVVYLRLVRNWKKLEKFTAYEWFGKIFGKESFNIIWAPLLISKFGEKAKEVGAVWLWGRIFERPSSFGYFRENGFETFIQAVKKYIESRGVEIKINSYVNSVVQKNDSFSLTLSDGFSDEFDQVIVAAPPMDFADIAKNLLSKKDLENITKLDYAGAVCALLISNQSFSPYYWINVMDDAFPFVAVVEQTNFVGKENYGGMYPIYLSRYARKDSEFYNMTEEKLWPMFFESMKKINPDFKEDWIKSKFLFKAPYTQPIVPTNYSDILPKYQTNVPGLWWVSMSHIYPWDRGTSHSFRIGRELARELLKKI